MEKRKRKNGKECDGLEYRKREMAEWGVLEKREGGSAGEWG